MIGIFISSLFILFSLWLGLYIKREIGKQPTIQQLHKFETLPYFSNGCFFNYYNAIDGFKNADAIEEANLSTFAVMKNLFFPKKVDVRKVILSKESFNKKPDNFSLYWLGHSSVILELCEKRIIIDPVFGNASMVPFVVGRYTSAPIKRKNLPNIDYVLITHNHYDHLERKTIQQLNKQKNITFIVPLSVGENLKYWGVQEKKIIELGWENEINLNNKIKITAEPAIHFSGRWLNDHGKTLWNSYVVQGNENNIFCAGDGAYGEQIDMIAKKYGKFTLAMIEIDAWNIRWPYFHMFTRESIEIIKKLKANFLLPVHWGVFKLAMHEFDTSINMLKNEAKHNGLFDKLLLPAMGEKIIFNQNGTKAIYNVKST